MSMLKLCNRVPTESFVLFSQFVLFEFCWFIIVLLMRIFSMYLHILSKCILSGQRDARCRKQMNVLKFKQKFGRPKRH